MWKMAWNSLLRFVRKEVPSTRRSISYSGGMVVSEDTAMQVSAYHRGVTYISSQIAKLPWEVKDKENNVIRDRDSSLLDLSPNPEMNSMMFRLTMVQNAIHHGNAYAEIERDMTGKAKAIWPIPSNAVELYRTRSGKLIYRVVTSYAETGGEVFIPYEDMFHIRNFHTKDGLMGQGIAAYAADVLGIVLGADRMAGNLFANGGLPSGVLQVEGVLSDEAYKRLEESWKQNNGGKRSAGVAILEQGAKFNPIVITPDLLQFLESRKFGVVEIARFLGLPPTKLFDTEAATFNNMENANLEVATDTLDAWARNFEMEADIKILNKQYGGKRSEMDLYAVFRGDMATRAEYFNKMMQSAAMTPNQIREREGLAGYKGGEKYYLANNNFAPIDRVDEIIDSQIAKNNTPAPQPAPKDDKLTNAAIHYLEKK